jgi:aryl-alcohol dehydrogenase-like predicted oxidoreductase
LAFSLSFPEIDRVVVGADSKRQLAQIIDAAKSERIIDMPNLKCDDENLINPARWRIL